MYPLDPSLPHLCEHTERQAAGGPATAGAAGPTAGTGGGARRRGRHIPSGQHHHRMPANHAAKY